MGWAPKEYFLNAQDFFGAIVPGAVGIAIVGFAARNTRAAADFSTLLSLPAQWVAFGVAALILGFVAYPVARNLDPIYDRWYVRRRRSKGDPLLERAIREADAQVRGISGIDSVYEWAKARVEARDPSVREDVARLQGISKMFRTLCVVLVFVGPVLVYLGQWLAAGACAVGLALSFLQFCERRWNATRLVYMRLADLPPDATTPSRIIVPK